MEIGFYKSRLKMIVNLIFNPTSVKKSVDSYRRKNEELIEGRFEDKIMMLKFEQLRNGIVSNDYKRDVLNVNIYGAEHYSGFNINQPMEFEEKQLNINPMMISFYKDDNKIEEIKHKAAQNIAKILVDENYLTARFQDNKIVFSVNTF